MTLLFYFKNHWFPDGGGQGTGGEKGTGSHRKRYGLNNTAYSIPTAKQRFAKVGRVARKREDRFEALLKTATEKAKTESKATYDLITAEIQGKIEVIPVNFLEPLRAAENKLRQAKMVEQRLGNLVTDLQKQALEHLRLQDLQDEETIMMILADFLD